MNAHLKKILETSLRGLVALSVFAAFAVASARAQNREEHFISAHAGGVNFVSGDVTARRAGEADWQRVTSKDDLKTGDAVRTGAGGRVEVLLNPGSYFRAGESTGFELVDASLDNLRLRLTRGSAVVEAAGYDRLGLDIAVATPQAHVRIIRGGVYRFGVLASGVTEVAVQKGRVLIGEGASAQVVKGGYVARVGAGGVELAKLDKNGRDALDLWSRERGRELAKLNEKLTNRQGNSLWARTTFNDLFSQGYSYGGVWAYSPGLSCYTFLPFGGGWSSPYGVGYSHFLYLPVAPGGGPSGQGGYRPGGNNNGGGGGTPNTGQNTGGGYTGGSSPVAPPNVPSQPPSPPPMPRTEVERPIEAPMEHGRPTVLPPR